MHRPMSALALAVLAAAIAVLAACTASAAPGWTYAPAPSVTPAPSVAASGSPAASASASAAASPSASAAASPSASASAAASGSAEPSGAAGLTITAPVGASTGGFDPTTLEATAGAAFTITFDNQDTGVPHNFVLTSPDGTKVDIGDTAYFNGPGQKTYNVPALTAGAYPFHCEIHPTTMTGTLTVD
jgi:plastocyanin